MSGLRGMFAGVLALIALETVLSTTDAANRTSGLFSNLAGLVTHVLDPNTPAIPDLRGASSSTTAAGSVPTGPAVLVPVPPTDRPPIVAPPPANGKPKPPKATVSI